MSEIKIVRDTCVEDYLRLRLREAEEVINETKAHLECYSRVEYGRENALEGLRKIKLYKQEFQFKADGKTLDV